ncbi:c-type cytochrome [Neptunicella sp.]|uniref:c-type cytochrome n=1 Tax=Neptunicella sp. TaxID=2125986 RepID=UPI003F68E998
MTSLKRISLYLLAALFALIILSLAVIWIWSSIILNRSYVPQQRHFKVAVTADINEGERLARIVGCIGCHGNAMQGETMVDDMLIGKLVAPNLTEFVNKYSDEQLEAAIRQGIAADGRGLLIMPASYFSALRDSDLSNIIAYIRQAPHSNGPTDKTSLGVMGRLLVINGELQTEPNLPMYSASPEIDNKAFIGGEYLTQIKCGECHGRDLSGSTAMGMPTPSLIVVKGYDLTEFSKLMREGVGKGNRDVGFMGELSRSHFSHLNDTEIEDLYFYLHNRT